MHSAMCEQLLPFSSARVDAALPWSWRRQRSNVNLRTATAAAADSGSEPGAQGATRRQALASATAAALASLQGLGSGRRPPQAAAAESVCNRMAAPATAPQQSRGGMRFGKIQPLQYPDWMFGEWQVTETYISNPVMAGAPILAIHSMQASGRLVQPGDSATFTQRYYSTLPDTLENQFRMNVGQQPLDATVADRAFNVTQAANAHGGYEVVTDAVYDPRESPGRQRMLFNGPASGMPQVVDLTLRELSGEFRDGGASFCAVEAYSQDQSGLSTDFEFLTTYTRMSADHVTARQREVYYGESQGILGGLGGAREPEAVFEYELDLRRAPPPSDAAGAASCVVTPKGFTQCV